MPKSFEDILSEELSGRLSELDEVYGLWVREPALRAHLDKLFVVRAYAHLEGGVKQAVNLYFRFHRRTTVSRLIPAYWSWRERSTVDGALKSVSQWDSVAARRAVLLALKPKALRPIDLKNEYNQMYSDRVVEILIGLGLRCDRVLDNSVTIDDLVRKRHLVAHGNGELPILSADQIGRYREAVSYVLIELWDQLAAAFPDGLLRK